MVIIFVFYIMAKMLLIAIMGFNAVTICANTYRYKMDSLFVGLYRHTVCRQLVQ